MYAFIHSVDYVSLQFNYRRRFSQATIHPWGVLISLLVALYMARVDTHRARSLKNRGGGQYGVSPSPAYNKHLICDILTGVDAKQRETKMRENEWKRLRRQHR